MVPSGAKTKKLFTKWLHFHPLYSTSLGWMDVHSAVNKASNHKSSTIHSKCGMLKSYRVCILSNFFVWQYFDLSVFMGQKKLIENASSKTQIHWQIHCCHSKVQFKWHQRSFCPGPCQEKNNAILYTNFTSLTGLCSFQQDSPGCCEWHVPIIKNGKLHDENHHNPNPWMLELTACCLIHINETMMKHAPETMYYGGYVADSVSFYQKRERYKST